MTELISSTIYSSRDHIRQELIKYITDYLELENIDLTKSSFLSYLINILSVLTSNLIFYSSSTYKEFFLTTAVIPESVYNLSAFIGYTPHLATPSVGNVLITVPLTFDDPNVSFNINRTKFQSNQIVQGHKLYANNIVFSPIFDCNINIINNSLITITASDDYRTFNLPIFTDSTNNTFSFLLPVSQIDYNVNTFTVDSDIQIYQFYDIEVPTKNQISDVEVRVKYPNDTGYRLFEKYDSLFLMSPITEGYVVRNTANGLRISFGNGLIGKRLEPSSQILVVTKETLGSKGNVIPGSINKIDDIYISTSGVSKKVKLTVQNTSSTVNGQDEESIYEVRTNAINNLTSLNRCVTENDYKNLDTILSDTYLKHFFPVLKQSDLKQNNITLFSNLIYKDEICPTRDAIWDLAVDQTSISQFDIINIDGIDYYSLFDIDIDVTNNFAYYTYTVKEINLTPILVESFNPDYRLTIDNFTAYRDSTGNVTISFHYNDSQVDYGTYGDFYAKITANLESISPVIKDTINKEIKHTFSPSDIPLGKVIIYITIYSSINDSEIIRYETTCTLKTFLDDFMYSSCNLLNIYESSTLNNLDTSNVIVSAYSQDLAHSAQNLVSNDSLYYLTDSTSTGAPGFVEFDFPYNVFINTIRFRTVNDSTINYHIKKFEVQYSLDNGNTWITIPYKLFSFPGWTDLNTTEIDQLPENSLSPLINFETIYTNRIRIVWWEVTHPNNTFCAIDEFLFYNTGQVVRRVYDVPVLLKDYYDSIDSLDFETNTLQPIINNIQFDALKMVTDFANIKLSNSTGYINLTYNRPTVDPVIDIDLTSIPTNPNVGDRYIVTGKEGPEWDGHEGEIAECTDSTNVSWYFFSYPVNSVVWVQNKNAKYFNSVDGWIVPHLSIPLKLKIQVKKDPLVSLDQQTLINDIKRNLVEYFTPIFGNNAEIYRSEIIKVVQETEGVEYCKLDEPEIDVIFNYDIEDFDQEQLLEYSPDLVYFTEDDINIYFI